MTAKEGIEKIKKLLFGDQTPPATETPKPAELIGVTTTDGKALQVDKMEIGGTVLLDGAAAPDGEYSLENGGKLSVVGGLITELELEPKPAEPAAPAESEMAKFAAEFNAFKAEFSIHKEAFTATQNELKLQKEAFSNLLNVVENLANASVAAPAAPQKKQWHEMSALEKFRASKQN